MLDKNNELIQKLADSLDAECRDQRRYFQILQEERVCVVKFNRKKLEEITRDRKELTKNIALRQRDRLELLQAIAKLVGEKNPELKVTTLADIYFDPEARRLIKEKAAVLREVIKLTQNKIHEISSIVQFSMKMVNGTMATMVRTTQDLNPVYNSYGKVNKIAGSVSKVPKHMTRTA